MALAGSPGFQRPVLIAPDSRHSQGEPRYAALGRTASGRLLTIYFDWEKSVAGSFPALKPSTQTISLRLPKALLEELKSLANERDVPYQSLLKIFLSERVARERGRRFSKP